MRFTIDCMLGRENDHVQRVSGRNKHRWTIADIFWSFKLNQVRQGLIKLEDLEAEALAAVSGGGDGFIGSSGSGSGSSSEVIGYTGNSPPILANSLALVSSRQEGTLLRQAKNHAKPIDRLAKVILLLAVTMLIFTACKKECIYDSSLKEDDAKCIPPTVVIPSDTTSPIDPTDTIPVVKKDVYLDYSFGTKNACGDNEDITEIYWENSLTSKNIADLKKLPETGNIIPRVYCKKARGPPARMLRDMMDRFDELKGSLTFMPDTVYMDANILPEDSLRALNDFKLTVYNLRGGDYPEHVK